MVKVNYSSQIMIIFGINEPSYVLAWLQCVCTVCGPCISTLTEYETELKQYVRCEHFVKTSSNTAIMLSPPSPPYLFNVVNLLARK